MIEPWANFLIAQVGASAALLGLVFVSISLNLPKILSNPYLPDRALMTMALLLAILLVASLLLIPGQPTWMMAAEILVVAAPAWAIGSGIEIRTFAQPGGYVPLPVQIVKFLVLESASLFYFIAAALLALGHAGALYWVAAAILVSILRAAFDAWVLLIEINR
jgi:hypothetical protein